jgi:hypothetical protein
MHESEGDDELKRKSPNKQPPPKEPSFPTPWSQGSPRYSPTVRNSPPKDDVASNEGEYERCQMQDWEEDVQSCHSPYRYYSNGMEKPTEVIKNYDRIGIERPLRLFIRPKAFFSEIGLKIT